MTKDARVFMGEADMALVLQTLQDPSLTKASSPSQEVIDHALALFAKEYNPDEPRDDHGRWSADGGGSALDEVSPWVDGGSGGGAQLTGLRFPPSQEEQAYQFTQQQQDHLSNPSYGVLSTDEKDAAQHYQGEPYFQEINGALRADQPQTQENAPVVANLDSAINKASFSQNIIAYRGVGDTTGQFTSLQTGDTFTDKGYSSTTLNPAVAELFAASANVWDNSAKEVVMEIQIPKGFPALASDIVSENVAGRSLKDTVNTYLTNGATRLNEVTLARGTTFEVLGQYISGNGGIVIQVRPQK